MGSIPLTALSARPPEDPTVAIQRAMQLKSLLQAQQLFPGQLQAQQQENQAREQENTIRAQQIKDQQAMTQAMQEWDGKNLQDLPGLVVKHGASAQAVLGLKSSIIQQQKSLTDLSKDQLANMAAVNDQLIGHIDTLKGVTDPVQRAQAAKAQGAQILNSPLAQMLDPQTSQMVQGMAQGQFVPNDDQLSLFEKGLTAHSKQIEQAKSEAQTNEANNRAAESGAQAKKIQAEIAFYQKKGLAPGVPLDVQEAVDWMNKNPGKGAADFMKMKAGLTAQENAKAQAGLLTGAAQEMAAQNYAQTGQLPAGMRSPGMSASILNKAASGQGGVPNIAANKATYQADSHSLAALQKQFDQVTAFENTAGKNLDVFLKTAEKVIDSGSPWVTKPLRSISANGLGSEDQAAFNAARTTALTEIAKVLNSSNASGVLSDSARHEVEGLIGPGASLKQIYSAANILKQDMANRHESYQNQINEIRGRLGGSQQSQSKYTPPVGAPTAIGPNGHKIVVDGGKWVDAATGQPIQ